MIDTELGGTNLEVDLGLSTSNSIDIDTCSGNKIIDANLEGANLEIELDGTLSHILNIELEGNTGYTKAIVHINTTAYWNSRPEFIGERGHIYVYTDASHDINRRPVPGIKIGDGSAYLIDNPFVSSDHGLLIDHINNRGIHITPEERYFWNQKVRCDDTTIQGETLIFTKN